MPGPLKTISDRGVSIEPLRSFEVAGRVADLQVDSFHLTGGKKIILKAGLIELSGAIVSADRRGDKSAVKIFSEMFDAKGRKYFKPEEVLKLERYEIISGIPVWDKKVAQHVTSEARGLVEQFIKKYGEKYPQFVMWVFGDRFRRPDILRAFEVSKFEVSKSDIRARKIAVNNKINSWLSAIDHLFAVFEGLVGDEKWVQDALQPRIEALPESFFYGSTGSADVATKVKSMSVGTNVDNGAGVFIFSALAKLILYDATEQEYRALKWLADRLTLPTRTGDFAEGVWRKLGERFEGAVISVRPAVTPEEERIGSIISELRKRFGREDSTENEAVWEAALPHFARNPNFAEEVLSAADVLSNKDGRETTLLDVVQSMGEAGMPVLKNVRGWASAYNYRNKMYGRAAIALGAEEARRFVDWLTPLGAKREIERSFERYGFISPTRETVEQYLHLFRVEGKDQITRLSPEHFVLFIAATSATEVFLPKWEVFEMLQNITNIADAMEYATEECRGRKVRVDRLTVIAVRLKYLSDQYKRIKQAERIIRRPLTIDDLVSFEVRSAPARTTNDAPVANGVGKEDKFAGSDPEAAKLHSAKQTPVCGIVRKWGGMLTESAVPEQVRILTMRMEEYARGVETEVPWDVRIPMYLRKIGVPEKNVFRAFRDLKAQFKAAR